MSKIGKYDVYLSKYLHRLRSQINISENCYKTQVLPLSDCCEATAELVQVAKVYSLVLAIK